MARKKSRQTARVVSESGEGFEAFAADPPVDDCGDIRSCPCSFIH
jgi:hypothetical protein